MGVPEIPDIDHWIRFQRCRSDKFRGLPSVRQTSQRFNWCTRNLYLFRVPSNGANSFSAHVVESHTLLLCLDIPHGHKTCTATGDQDMCNLLIPVQALDIVRTGSVASQSEWVFDIVEVGDVELRKTISQMNNGLEINICNTSPFAPAVARRFGCLGLN